MVMGTSVLYEEVPRGIRLIRRIKTDSRCDTLYIFMHGQHVQHEVLVREVGLVGSRCFICSPSISIDLGLEDLKAMLPHGGVASLANYRVAPSKSHQIYRNYRR